MPIAQKKIAGKIVTMAPTKVALSPTTGSTRGMQTTIHDANARLIDRVVVTGGKAPYKSFVEEGALYYEKPNSTLVIFSDGGFDLFLGPDCDLVRIYGGTMSAVKAPVVATRGVARRFAQAERKRRLVDVVGCYYQAGMDAIVGEDGIPRQRGAFDKYQTYEAGDYVIYPPIGGAWRTYVALRRVTPPWFPMWSEGDVPGRSDAWTVAYSMPKGPDVIGGGPYTDLETVRRVQERLISLAEPGAGPTGSNPQYKALIDDMKAHGGADAVLGSRTKAAIAWFNRVHRGVNSDAIDDDLMTALSLTLPREGRPMPPPAPPRPGTLPVTVIPPSGGVPGIAPTGLAAASAPWMLGGVPAWQVGVGVLASTALGYGVYRAVKR